MPINFSKFFHRQVWQYITGKELIKYPTKSQTAVATLPCEMFVLKNRHAAELSEANCRSKQFLKYSLNDVSIIVSIIIHWQKHTYNDHTEKSTAWATVHTSINQEERRRDKTQRSVTDDISNSLTLVDHGVKVNDEY